jgi:hypothetical protein
MEYYTDRAYTLTSLPSVYIGMDTILTPNDDLSNTAASDYLTFEMPYDGTVYVAYDSRATSLPNWLRGFTDTGDRVYTSLSTQPYLKVYKRSYSSGDCINLGANKAPGFSGGTVSNYMVFYGGDVGPSVCVLAPKFEETTLRDMVAGEASAMYYYTDRTYTLTGVPSAYIGMNTILTPNDDLNRTDASDYLTFEMPYDGTVYVAYDSRATSLPNWLRGFTDTGDRLLTSLSTQPSLKVYKRSYSSGDCINLGANKAPGFSGGTVSNYMVFYGDDVGPSGCFLASKFNETTLRSGTRYYTDRDYTLTSVPSAYIGMDSVLTPNDDRNLTATSDYLTFEMPYDGMVYLAYDGRATSLPYWFSIYTDTGDRIYTSLSSQPYLKVYKKFYSAGDCVNFGANKASGFSGGTVSNYMVFYGGDVGPSGCVLASKFEETTLSNGMEYYTDRTYTLTGVHSSLLGFDTILTPNDDRNRTDASGYMTFRDALYWLGCMSPMTAAPQAYQTG